jgi:PAS domain S-box-containing protein
MDKEQYIKQGLQNYLKFWGSLGLIAGAGLFISLSILDYFITPENFRTFLVYRLSCAALLIILYFFNRQEIKTYVRNIIILLVAVITSVTLELMILSFGGHQSTYYAGIIITIVFMLGAMPVSFGMSLSIVIIAYSIYLLPILLYDRISNLQMFINNNTFLIATFMIALMWRFLSQKSLIKELGLQYDLDQQKRELEMYSQKLEHLVVERTKELHRSELMFRSLFEYATDGVMILDTDGKIVNINKKACEIHQSDKESLVGSNIKLLETEENLPMFRERMERILRGESLIYETQHYRKDGSLVSLEVSVNAIEIGGNIMLQSFQRDVTEKKSIQEQLSHSQKMESIGLLAGGIAHNFNNMLSAILGYVELMQEDDALDSVSKKRLRNIEGAARKSGDLVSKLLSFARRDRHEVNLMNLHNVINDSVKLMRGMLSKGVEIEVELGDVSPFIEGDPNQLEHVLMNMIINARDAMKENGVITIKTRLVDIMRGVPDMPGYISPGKYVLLTISDTGHGIPRDSLKRIFEPFFTTKEKGKGTGLGLAMVYGIIKDHKGYIDVQSENGNGTVFSIYLPLSGKQALPESIESRKFAKTFSGNESILVVDDEEDILNYIREICEKQGYNVLTANEAISAVGIFKENIGSIELVITDIIMPVMTGKDLSRRLKAIKPGIKIIAISGYGNEAEDDDNMLIDVFLKKPFEGALLLSTVRQLLNKAKKS